MNYEVIQQYIMRDMAEGVMVIGFDGVIHYMNPAAERILERNFADISGKAFAQTFFEYEQNDAFNQTILDVIYDRNRSHKDIVDYFTGERTKQLHVTTSYLKFDISTIGVVCMLSDVTELNELRDAMKAMEQIKALNSRLELRNSLLSETFGRFLSDEIVRQLLETPDGLALGGKKRCLSVLMSDLRGFTAISEQMDAQSLLDMLNYYLGAMTEIIQKYNGTIIEFIGDGIMAIFGAPVPDDNHATLAVAAAVEMQSKMAEINGWNRQRNYPVLQMGIGINTGEVIVGNIGSDKRTKYGVVGNEVNLAGRIESYTVGGQILIAPQTKDRLSSEVIIAGEQKVFPKGLAEPIVLTHVVGLGAPYNLNCNDPKSEPRPLAKPIPVQFLCIDDKHVSDVQEAGYLTSLCSSGAVLETEVPLALYQNLVLDIGGKLFAKIIREGETEFLLRFTSFPKIFDSWFRRVLEDE